MDQLIAKLAPETALVIYRDAVLMHLWQRQSGPGLALCSALGRKSCTTSASGQAAQKHLQPWLGKTTRDAARSCLGPNASEMRLLLAQ